jgi:hypothetical protein
MEGRLEELLFLKKSLVSKFIRESRESSREEDRKC